MIRKQPVKWARGPVVSALPVEKGGVEGSVPCFIGMKVMRNEVDIKGYALSKGARICGNGGLHLYQQVQWCS